MTRFSSYFWGILIIFCNISRLMAQAPEKQKLTSWSGDTLRLEYVVKDVVQHNDRAAAAGFMEKAAIEKIGPAGAWDDPMLMIGVQNLPTNFDFKMDPMTMKMIGISQNIPYAGQKGLQSEAAKFDALVSDEDKRNTEIDLATAAKYSYFDLYYRQATLNFIQEQHSLQEQVVSAAMAKLRTDQVSQADVAAAEADLWRLESDLLSSKQDIESAYNNLLALMGKGPGAQLPILAKPDAVTIPESADVWYALAKDSYPPLLKTRHQSQSYAFSAAAARRMRWPMLSLSASYGIRQSTEMEKRDNMVSFQANISLPIFQGRQQNNMAKSMEAMHSGTELEANQMERDIQADINTLYSNAQRLEQSLRLYQEQIVPADQDAFASALSGYSANRIPFANLLAYSSAIYHDRITANQISYDLARTIADAQKYFTNPDIWNEK
jgi:cobalt-zinc-cadmium efflux system outer membrane protein